LPPRRSTATKIPLKLLFIFPTDPGASSDMEYFWKGGIQNLDKEMEIHEMLCSSLESTGETDSVEELIEALRL
jgi:hypothetical protein